MSSTYNAITNLQEIEMDSLIVNTATIDTALIDNLDCNVGTIDTLTSSTATITSANIPTLTNTTLTNTTSNTTNLNTNNIQPTPVSSSVSLYTNGTGTLVLGNTSNTNALTINQNTTIGTGKKITTPALNISGLTASLLTKTDASKNIISSLYSETTLPVSTPQQTALDLKSNIANPTFTTGITTPLITFNGVQTASKLLLTNASKVVVSSAYDETTLPVSTPQQTALDLKSNIANPTFTTGITTPLLTFNGVQTASKLLLTNASKVVVSSAYDETTLPVSTPQQTALDLKSNLASPTFTGTVIIPTLVCNTISASSTTSTGSLFGNILAGAVNIAGSLTGSLNVGTSMRNGILTIGSSSFNIGTDTGYAVINLPVYFNQDINIDTGKDIVMSSNGLIKSETLTGLAYNLTLNLGENGDSAGINCNRTMTFANNKNIVMNSTGIISVDTLRGTATTISPTIYTNITDPASTITIGNSANAGVVVNSDLFVNSTKSLGCNNIYSYSSGDLNLNTFNSANFINLLNNTKVSSGKYITCEKYDSINATTALAIGSTNTTALIRIGGALTSGVLELGTSGTMTGGIRCNGDLSIGTTANNKGIACNYFTALQATDLVRFLQSTTTGNVRICENHSTGGITIGHLTPASDSGTLTINKNTTLATNKNLTLGNQSKLVGGSNGSVNITAVSYTNVSVIASASLAGFYEVFIYGASATQTYSVCCFLSADNSGAIQTTASRNMTFQFSSPNYTITATVAPTSTISMNYNIVRLF